MHLGLGLLNEGQEGISWISAVVKFVLSDVPDPANGKRENARLALSFHEILDSLDVVPMQGVITVKSGCNEPVFFGFADSFFDCASEIRAKQYLMFRVKNGCSPFYV